MRSFGGNVYKSARSFRSILVAVAGREKMSDRGNEQRYTSMEPGRSGTYRCTQPSVSPSGEESTDHAQSSNRYTSSKTSEV